MRNYIQFKYIMSENKEICSKNKKAARRAAFYKKRLIPQLQNGGIKNYYMTDTADCPFKLSLFLLFPYSSYPLR